MRSRAVQMGVVVLVLLEEQSDYQLKGTSAQNEGDNYCKNIRTDQCLCRGAASTTSVGIGQMAVYLTMTVTVQIAMTVTPQPCTDQSLSPSSRFIQGYDGSQQIGTAKRCAEPLSTVDQRSFSSKFLLTYCLCQCPSHGQHQTRFRPSKISSLNPILLPHKRFQGFSAECQLCRASA